MSEGRKLVLLSQPSQGASARASSVLQRNSRLYGPMNALDLENSSTCWNSAGSPSGNDSSFFLLDFGRPVQPIELRVQFQAGFIAEQVNVFWKNGESWEEMTDLEVEDDHDLQIHELLEGSNPPTTNAVKFVFDEYTDFYGRVTIYQLQVWGLEV